MTTPYRSELTVLAVEGTDVLLSSGEVVFARYEKLRDLCVALQQEMCPVTIRTWWTPKGTELIEIHRVVQAAPVETMKGTADVF